MARLPPDASTARPGTARELTQDAGLSEADYDVLSDLSETPQGRLRLRELADRMLWSRSRLSHHLTRMQQRGLVTREECADDGRGSMVVLTPPGGRPSSPPLPATWPPSAGT